MKTFKEMPLQWIALSCGVIMIPWALIEFNILGLCLGGMFVLFKGAQIVGDLKIVNKDEENTN